MSIPAVSWALYESPAGDPTARLILVHLAEHADKDGRGTYPSVPTIAEDIEVSERTVQRHLAAMEDRGLICRGDQELVSHYRADCRPVVWDLNMAMKRPPREPKEPKRRGVKMSPRPAAAGRQNVTPSDANGVTPVTERGDTGVANGVTPVSPKPSFEPDKTPTESNRPVTREAARDTHEAPTGSSLPFDSSPAQHKPKASRSERATRLPEDFALTDGMRNYAISKGVRSDAIDDMFEHFKNHHIGKGTRWEKWDRAWMTWVQNSPRFRGGTVTNLAQRRPMNAYDRTSEILDAASAGLAAAQLQQDGFWPHVVIDGETA